MKLTVKDIKKYRKALEKATMSVRFDLEQQIMDCWHVVDDIHVLVNNVYDHNPPLTEDQIGNILLGMEQLYQLKFEKLFELFEEYIRENRNRGK